MRFGTLGGLGVPFLPRFGWSTLATTKNAGGLFKCRSKFLRTLTDPRWLKVCLMAASNQTTPIAYYKLVLG